MPCLPPPPRQHYIDRYIRNQAKTARNSNFLRFTWNITQKSTLHDFCHKVYFYFWKKLKKQVQMPWPPATRDVRSRNHSNWPSLNVSQSVRGMNEQLVKTSGADVLSSTKKIRKTLWGRGVVRGVNLIIIAHAQSSKHYASISTRNTPTMFFCHNLFKSLYLDIERKF